MDNKFIIDNKPFNITSFKFIKSFKSEYKKVGHSGTLDPYATGALCIATNFATKFLQYLPSDKKYFFEIEFGYKTNTDDLDGDVIEKNNIMPDKDKLASVIHDFIGEISQVPSKFSALKVDGKRAYELARKNIDFELKPRTVNIFSLKMLSFDNSKASFEVHCSGGTYVRSLASDICDKLGVLGCVTKLHRTFVNGFELKEERSFFDLSCFEMFYDKYILSSICINKLKNGVKINLSLDDFKIISVFDDKNVFYGLAEVRSGFAHPLYILR